MPPRRRGRPLILGPGFWHPQAVRPRDFLRNGPVAWRPPTIGIGAYTRPVTGIPLTGGQGATSVSSSGTGAQPAIVQTKVIAGALSGSFTNPTTAGNCVVVIVNAINVTSGDVPSISGVTLGGAAGNFTNGATGVSAFVGGPIYALAGIWVDYNCAGGQTAIAVSGSNLTVNAATGIIIYEVSGITTSNPIDKFSSAGASVAGTAWSSGVTATTSQASEIWFGADTTNQSATQPGAPWVNSQYLASNIGGGYQITTAAAAASYAGTQGSADAWAAAVVTLKSTFQPSTPGLATISVGPQGLGNVWYPAQVTVSTTSGVNDTSTCQIFLGPAGIPITLLGTIYPGGAGTLAAAVPPLSPGQYLIAQWTGGNPGDVAAINVIGTMDSVMPA